MFYDHDGDELERFDDRIEDMSAHDIVQAFTVRLNYMANTMKASTIRPTLYGQHYSQHCTASTIRPALR